MTGADRAADLRRLSAHPYLVSADLDDATGVEPLTRPTATSDVLDLTFGAADALVELHHAGHAHGAIGPTSLVRLGSGGYRLAAPPPNPVPGASPAADVAALAAAARDLLPAANDDTPDDTPDGAYDVDESDRADPDRTAAARQLFDSAAGGAFSDAAGFRDAVAAVRLGRIVPGPRLPSAPTAADSTSSASGTRSSDSGDRQRLRDVGPTPGRSDAEPAGFAAPKGLLVTLVVVAVVLAAAIVFMLTVAPF